MFLVLNIQIDLKFDALAAPPIGRSGGENKAILRVVDHAEGGVYESTLALHPSAPIHRRRLFLHASPIPIPCYGRIAHGLSPPSHRDRLYSTVAQASLCDFDMANVGMDKDTATRFDGSTDCGEEETRSDVRAGSHSRKEKSGDDGVNPLKIDISSERDETKLGSHGIGHPTEELVVGSVEVDKATKHSGDV
ncbi:hypothetical protein GUJ93_ZPchr0009g1103 [Zizania palustris]|uniref:Uncharacterized protein n=1 Tax=Zizania palustris TaxID=103762 RepID=A0A8J5RXM0_ZIZPA|nr:hypothetical protein GUJ93_ZPchr0009g1103 [Zizania palustris]